MNRPQRRDKNVVHLAASLMVARLRENHPDIFEYDEDGDGVHKDLVEALTYSDDGYEMAKALDRKGWNCDADLVETLNGGCLSDAYDDLLEKWIAWHAIKPKFAIGAKVTVTSLQPKNGSQEFPGGKYRPSDFVEKTAVGEISGINLKRGTYTVRVAEWGHKMPGELGTQGLVFDWERVEAANVHPS